MFDITIEDYIKSSKKTGHKMVEYFLPGVLINNSVHSKVLDESLLCAYEDHLNKYRKSYTFTNEEFRKYKFNPWKLAYDVYGSTEYWFLILHANQMYSAAEFCKRTVSMYKTDVIDLLNEITAISDRDVRKAKNNVKKDVEKYSPITNSRLM